MLLFLMLCRSIWSPFEKVDTVLSYMRIASKLGRRTIFQGRVSFNTIIKYFNIFKDTSASLLHCFVFLKINEIRLWCVGKRSHKGVVVTISWWTHALNRTVLFYKIHKSIVGILRSPIWMEHNSSFGFFFNSALRNASTISTWLSILKGECLL